MRIYILVMLGIYLVSCEENHPGPVTYNSREGVFICNEGTFTFGNASLSFYEKDSFRISNRIFFNKNLFPLGDVAQSMTILDSVGFVIINNSGKINVIHTGTFELITTIGGFTSPRYMAIINNQKAYITDLYSKSITIIDPVSFATTGHLRVGRSTEQLAVLGDHAYVTSWSMSDMIYKINHQEDQLIDSLKVPKQPNSIVIDRDNKIWVLSDGGFNGSPAGQELPALTRIDPEQLSILKSYRFPGIDASPDEMTINSSGDTLYFINGGWSGSAEEIGGIYRMSIYAEDLPSSAFIDAGNRLIYGLGVDPVNSDIYVSDARDFLSRGWVYRYRASGTHIDSFQVEIGPGSFSFYNQD